MPGANVIAQKILSAVARTGQRFGSRYVIDVLRGSNNDKVRQRGHDRISTFGVLAELSVARLGNFIDQLIDAGDLTRSAGEYPVLSLTSGSAELLRGDRQAVLMQPRGDLDRGNRRVRGRGADKASRQLSSDDSELFETLRTLRRRIAGQLAVPPYVVFSDATLAELAAARPSDPAGFLRVKGVGQKKLDSFGEQFLGAIAAAGGQASGEAGA